MRRWKEGEKRRITWGEGEGGRERMMGKGKRGGGGDGMIRHIPTCRSM